MGGKYDATVRELSEVGFAETSLLSNLRAIEAYEVGARARMLGKGGLPTQILQRLARFLMEDAQHLSATATTSSGWMSEDLTHSLETSLHERNPLIVELGHTLLVEPSLKALTELLAPSQIRRKDIIQRMSEEEEAHHRVYQELTIAGDLDRAFSEYVAANGLLLYVTVFPSEEGRAMLLTLLGKDSDEHETLKPFYTHVDEMRQAAVAKLFGRESMSFREVKGYGLAKSGLC